MANRILVNVSELPEYFYLDNHSTDDESSDDCESERESDDGDDEDVGGDVLEQLRAFVRQEEEQAGVEDDAEDAEGDDEDGGGSGHECEVAGADGAPSLQQRLKCKCKPGQCIGAFPEGRISTGISRGEQTSSAKHKAKERVKSRNVYRLEGVVLCRPSFCHINNISKNTLSVLNKHYLENGVVPRHFLPRGRTKKAVTKIEALRIVEFLKSTGRIHALALPGRVPGFKKTDVKVLPSHLTVNKLWKEYCSSLAAMQEPPRSISTFRRVWRSVVPFIIISRPSSDLCWTCQQYNINYKHVVNRCLEDKERRVQAHRDHLKAAAEAREFMNECIDRCRALLKDDASLQRRQPLTGPEEAHDCFDFAQQLHYPCDPHQPGPIYFKTPRKCGIFGVCCPSMPCQVNYLIDEAVSTSKGANAVISYLHHFLEEYGHGEKHLILHADNCAGQNKNNAMMAYLLWRVSTGRNLSAQMNFLIAGHTKFSCDLCFGWLKKKTRVTKLSCLDDIVQAVTNSAVANKTQLVGDQNGAVIVGVRDWSSFLKVKKIQGIKKHHQFLVSAEKPGIVTVKKYFNSTTSTEHRMWQHAPEGSPSEITPAGLDLARRKYLYKEIREFCTPKTRDIVCPLPHASEEEELTGDRAEDGAPVSKRRK